MRYAVDIIEFLTRDYLLGPFFQGSSWDRHRAILRAAFALPMSADDLRLFAEVAGNRAPPKKPVRELVLCVGRGGGKDSVASAIAAWIAATTDTSRLRPGERTTILVMATDRDQAGIAFSMIRGYFERVPALADLVERIADDVIDLSNGARIEVVTSSVAAPRGRTIACAIYDEVAFWAGEGLANADVDVDAAVTPGLVRFPGSIKILISSVAGTAGLLYDKYVEYFGKDDDDVLVVLGTSLQFNPTLDTEAIERAIAADPERASAEYLSIWRSDIATLFDRELVEAAVDAGVMARPPVPGVEYVAFADTSSGRGSAFVTAIAHAEEGGVAVIDALLERRAPFNVADAVAESAALLRQYGIAAIEGDGHAVEFVIEAYARHGIAYRRSTRDKSAVFAAALPLFTAGKARILDSRQLAYQLTTLRRRATRTRDIIAAPHHAADDLANAVCGALVLAATEAAPAVVRVSGQQRDGAVEPGLCHFVYAALWISAFGTAAVVYAAQRFGSHDQSLVILDADFHRQMSAAVLAEAADKLAALAAETLPRRDRFGRVWLWVPEAWQARADAETLRALEPLARSGRLAMAAAEAISPRWLADPMRLLYSAGAHFGTGRVLFTQQALDKAATMPLFGALAWTPGTRERIEDDPLRMAALLAVALALDEENRPLAPIWLGAVLRVQ